ncbi:MAG: hypothetical protein ACKO8G_03225 [Actinomycetota bacterium]
MKAFRITVGLVLLATLALGAPATARTNAKPHFVPSSFTGMLDPNTGKVFVGYQVGGLGNRGYGFISAKGRVTVEAQCRNGSGNFITAFEDKTWRVNEHDIFGNRDGNYKGTDELPPAAPCPPGTSQVSARITWSDVDLTLKSSRDGRTYDYHWFGGYQN